MRLISQLGKDRAEMIAPYDTTETAARDAALAMIRAGLWTLLVSLLTFLQVITTGLSGIVKVCLGLFSLLLWVIFVAQRDIQKARQWVLSRPGVSERGGIQ